MTLDELKQRDALAGAGATQQAAPPVDGPSENIVARTRRKVPEAEIAQGNLTAKLGGA